MRSIKTLLIFGLTLAVGAQQQLVAEDEAAPEGGGGFFDLFGRKIEPDAAVLEGDMPAGPLKIVMDRNAPRFGSKRRSSSSSGRTTRAKPIWSKRIEWSKPNHSMVNSGGRASGGEANHLVKSGGRVYLKSY